MRKFFIASLLYLSFVVTAHAAISNELISGLNQFAFTTHKHIYQAGKSAVYSPYSIGVLLELLVNGSAGKTRDELMQAFNLQTSTNLNIDIDALNQSLTNNKDVLISNAFWVDKHFNFNPDYLNGIKQMHSVAFSPVDFARDAAAIKAQINTWADKSTQGYIKTLLDEPLSKNTKLVLTNAIYFKGLWAMPFDRKQTTQQAFVAENGHKKMLPMMHRTERFHYAENDKLQMLVLHYDHSNLAMAVLLPKAGQHLQDINAYLTPDQFKSLSENADKMQTQVVVSLPKFKIDSQFSSELKQALKNSGIRDAFDPVKANFANMISGASPGLYISEAIQKAVIEVDEKGTVAAAASAVVVGLRSMAPGTPPIVFQADHPFLFVIFDKVTGLLLFIGETQ